METIITAAITGGLALIGVIISNFASNTKMQVKLETQQAVTNAKIEDLAREVREHNNFARRMPVLEEQMRVANHRIADLESARK